MSQLSNQKERLLVSDDSAIANLMDSARFEHMFRIASAMAASRFLPEHLLGKKKGNNFEYFSQQEIQANCFLIVNQAFRWGVDPFALAPETYSIGGKLAYQGKLISAIVNAKANLEGRVKYIYSGKKGTDEYMVTVSGTFRGESEPSEVTLTVGQGRTDNAMWKKDPEQKLAYSGIVKWARRYCPEVIMGILTDDDLEHIEIDRKQTQNVTFRNVTPEVKALPEPQAEEAEIVEPEEQITAQDKLFDLCSEAGFNHQQVIDAAVLVKVVEEGQCQVIKDLPEEACAKIIDRWGTFLKKVKPLEN